MQYNFWRNNRKGSGMTQGQELLTLIETVDHTDSAAMDEIDILFFRFARIDGCYPAIPIHVKNSFPKFTRDLNALKAVMDAELEEFSVDIKYTSGIYTFCSVMIYQSQGFRVKNDFHSPEPPTMHLAWLHAIIQAIIWKRENGIGQ